MSTYQPPVPYEVNGNRVYDVERITDRRFVKRGRRHHKMQQLVRWAGYAPEHKGWEPEVNLRDVPEPLSRLAEYRRASGAQATDSDATSATCVCHR